MVNWDQMLTGLLQMTDLSLGTNLVLAECTAPEVSKKVLDAASMQKFADYYI